MSTCQCLSVPLFMCLLYVRVCVCVCVLSPQGHERTVLYPVEGPVVKGQIIRL